MVFVATMTSISTKINTTKMSYTIEDDEGSTASLTSLHSSDDFEDQSDEFEDLSGSDVHAKRTIFGQRTNRDISMDLNDLLQELEVEKEGSQNNCDVSMGSISIGLNDDANSPLHVGSKLDLDDLPSERGGMDWGSLNWGSFMGSFRKRGGSSRKLGSSRRLLRRKDSKMEPNPEQPDRRRKKKVRFKKFETVWPSMESFNRLNQRDVPKNHNC
jgi:hypothetical protein